MLALTEENMREIDSYYYIRVSNDAKPIVTIRKAGYNEKIILTDETICLTMSKALYKVEDLDKLLKDGSLIAVNRKLILDAYNNNIGGIFR